jgi:hypothetical protein
LKSSVALRATKSIYEKKAEEPNENESEKIELEERTNEPGEDNKVESAYEEELGEPKYQSIKYRGQAVELSYGEDESEESTFEEEFHQNQIMVYQEHLEEFGEEGIEEYLYAEATEGGNEEDTEGVEYGDEVQGQGATYYEEINNGETNDTDSNDEPGVRGEDFGEGVYDEGGDEREEIGVRGYGSEDYDDENENVPAGGRYYNESVERENDDRDGGFGGMGYVRRDDTVSDKGEVYQVGEYWGMDDEEESYHDYGRESYGPGYGNGSYGRGSYDGGDYGDDYGRNQYGGNHDVAEQWDGSHGNSDWGHYGPSSGYTDDEYF